MQVVSGGSGSCAASDDLMFHVEHRPALIVVSGLPGTGKSTIAGRVTDALGAVLLAKDHVEAALWRRGVGRGHCSAMAAHEVITVVAADALAAGHLVVLDTVGGAEHLRADWRRVADDTGADFVVLLCECSDVVEHERRLLGRDRGIAGWPELAWSDVQATRSRWEPWIDPVVALDAVNPLATNVSDALAYIARSRT